MADKTNWISPWWQAVMLPDRWDVSGVTVPALSVWHTFALENIGNAYLCGGKCDRDSAASLLIVCSRNMADGKALWWNATRRTSAMRQMHDHLRAYKWEQTHAACLDYVTTCTRVCSRWSKGQGGKPCAVPYQVHIVHRLCANYGLTMGQAWDYPFALGRCLFDAAAEANGDDSLLSVKAQEMEDNWPEYQRQQQEAK